MPASRYTIGPYTFSGTDAERTVANLSAVWTEFERGRDASVIAPLYPSLTGDLEHDLQAVWHAWCAAGPALRAAGQLPSRVDGRIAGLHRSDGGVPKQPVEQVDVDWRGVVGDRQKSRTHHGRPWQALCLWSDEVIAAFRADGHPIDRGFAGENVTTAGIPWSAVRPGVRLRLGTVLCEVVAFATPCRHNAAWFLDGDFMVMHADRGPVSRVYATVLEPGTIRVDDVAVLEP